MAQSPNWYADGTFKTSAPLFMQLYTVHRLWQSNVISTALFLLPNKSQSTYERAVRALRILKPDLIPQSMMTDFENAALNTFKKLFPTCKSRGFFFHLSQSIWRQIEQYPDVQERYKQDPDFTLNEAASCPCLLSIRRSGAVVRGTGGNALFHCKS
ncbi:UNVERIFIED_CONTAM: hypothetical protein FKN15_067038 [Acipenser sinensis]